MTIRTIAVLSVLAALAVAASAQRPAAQIDTGTNVGVVGVRIAVPEFQAVSSDAKTAALATVFNKVLWDDLDYSGGVTLVSRSFYPLGKFSAPSDIRPEAWTTPDVNAQYVAFGNIRAADGAMFVEARLWDVKAPQNREAIAQRLRSDDSEEGARLIAHKFADAIIELIGGGRGIAQTYIAYISERAAGVKELYVMDYDG